MSEIAEFCRNLKKDFIPKIQNPTKPVRCWIEKDVLNGKIVDTFVIIFRTRGCSWALNSGCSMCGYYNDSMWNKVSDKDLLKQFEVAMQKYSGEKFVKIFTSGSFLDYNEINPKVRNEILCKLGETISKVSTESSPEYILLSIFLNQLRATFEFSYSDVTEYKIKFKKSGIKSYVDVESMMETDG